MKPAADKKYFSESHIRQHVLKTSPSLTEQAVHCLELVSELAGTGLTFRFKGGNSLLLLSPEPRRFSIDVDIATDAGREILDAAVFSLEEKHQVFFRIQKRVHVTKPWLPIASYYLYYKSHFTTEKENFIMLDAVLHKTPYAGKTINVKCGSIYSSDASAEVATVSGLIADKLLTLGPSTLGIPLNKNKAGQRLKHANDVSSLLGQHPVRSEITEALTGCLHQENILQKTSFSHEDIFTDTLSLCRLSLSLNNNKYITASSEFSQHISELIQGTEEMKSFLFSGEYNQSSLRTDFSRIALCISLLHTPPSSASSTDSSSPSGSADGDKLFSMLFSSDISSAEKNAQLDDINLVLNSDDKKLIQNLSEMMETETVNNWNFLLRLKPGLLNTLN